MRSEKLKLPAMDFLHACFSKVEDGKRSKKLCTCQRIILIINHIISYHMLCYAIIVMLISWVFLAPSNGYKPDQRSGCFIGQQLKAPISAQKVREPFWECAALERAGQASEPKRGYFIRC